MVKAEGTDGGFSLLTGRALDGCAIEKCRAPDRIVYVRSTQGVGVVLCLLCPQLCYTVSREAKQVADLRIGIALPDHGPGGLLKAFFTT